MANLADTILSETQRLACRVLSDDSVAVGFLNTALRLNPAGQVIGQGLGAIRNTVRNLACPTDGAEARPGDLLNGLPGGPGQCPTDYRIRVVVDRYFSNGTLRVEGATFQSANPFRGPITNVFIVNNNAGTVTVEYGNNQSGPLFSNGSTDTFRDLRDVTFERLDGLADDCGDSPDGRPRYRGPVTYQDDNGNDITEDVDIVFDNPNDGGGGGGLTIPFGWFAPTLEINPNLNLDLEPEIDFSPGDGCSLRPEIDIPDVPPTPEDPPPPDDARTLVGIIVATERLTQEVVTGVFGDGGPTNIFLPNHGFALLGARVGPVSAWLKPVPLNLLKQWVPVEGELPVYTWEIVSQNGFRHTVTPVYVDQQETSS